MKKTFLIGVILFASFDLYCQNIEVNWGNEVKCEDIDWRSTSLGWVDDSFYNLRQKKEHGLRKKNKRFFLEKYDHRMNLIESINLDHTSSYEYGLEYVALLYKSVYLFFDKGGITKDGELYVEEYDLSGNLIHAKTLAPFDCKACNSKLSQRYKSPSIESLFSFSFSADSSYMSYVRQGSTRSTKKGKQYFIIGLIALGDNGLEHVETKTHVLEEIDFHINYFNFKVDNDGNVFLAFDRSRLKEKDASSYFYLKEKNVEGLKPLKLDHEMYFLNELDFSLKNEQVLISGFIQDKTEVKKYFKPEGVFMALYDVDFQNISHFNTVRFSEESIERYFHRKLKKGVFNNSFNFEFDFHNTPNGGYVVVEYVYNTHSSSGNSTFAVTLFEETLIYRFNSTYNLLNAPIFIPKEQSQSQDKINGDYQYASYKAYVQGEDLILFTNSKIENLSIKSMKDVERVSYASNSEPLVYKVDEFGEVRSRSLLNDRKEGTYLSLEQSYLAGNRKVISLREVSGEIVRFGVLQSSQK